MPNYPEHCRGEAVPRPGPLGDPSGRPYGTAMGRHGATCRVAPTVTMNRDTNKHFGWKSIVANLALFLALPAVGLATTVTGTVKKADGLAVASGLIILRLSQNGTAGGSAVSAGVPITCVVTAGNIASGCTATGNDAISPAGTYYWIEVVSTGGLPYIAKQRYTVEGVTWDFGAATPLASATIGAAAYQIVQDEGTSLTQQRKLNFTGSGVACANDATNSRTNCAVSGGSGTWANEEGPAGQINGINVTFTLAHAPSPATSLRLVYNGMTLRSGAGNDFTLSGLTITFLYAPTSGSNLIAWYQY